MSLPGTTLYPASAADRDRWILDRRGPREPLDPTIPYAFLTEQERFADGQVGPVATIFLTNRECPWRCAMCDLWRHTLTEPVPPGAIPAQIAYALSRMPEAQQIKLYNSGSFFDPHAIPPADDAVVAEQVNGFERVIVESHPALIGARCFALQRLLQGQLEVAMGLETAHPGVLEKLNKRMTLGQYATAASSLRGGGIDLRSFVLLQPPFMIAEEALEWACRSIDFAFDCGATAITLIPTRSGNGSVDDLARAGLFTAPQLSLLEDALAYGVGLRQGRVFVDLWDIGRVRSCAHCRAERVERLRIANLQQQIGERVDCVQCGGRA